MPRPLRILLVEDDTNDALLMQRSLERAGFELVHRRVETAEAVGAAFDEAEWDIVLADYNLPGFKGPAVLEIIEARGLDVPLVIVSGAIDLPTALSTLKAGARDFVLKDQLARLPSVIERELAEAVERRERLRVEAERDALLVDLRRSNEELSRERDANARLYERERRIAETLQESLLSVPASMEGLEVAHFYGSATENMRVGGDFFDIFEAGGGLAAFAIGDVSGKGLDAASITALVKNGLRAHAVEGDPPGVVMSKTNDVVHRFTNTDMFVTAFFGILDTGSGLLSYCNAGHPHPLVVSAEGISQLTGDGLLLGAFQEVAYSTLTARLLPGQTLVLHTDGLTDARDGSRFFGEERLLTFLTAVRTLGPRGIVAALSDEIAAFTGGRLSDDIAVLALRLLP